jgi:hypothetical protein
MAVRAELRAGLLPVGHAFFFVDTGRASGCCELPQYGLLKIETNITYINQTCPDADMVGVFLDLQNQLRKGKN